MKHGFIVFESDNHAGHREGLTPRKVTKLTTTSGEEIEVYPQLTATQERLLALREKNIEALPELTKRKPWIYVNLGDQTQGNKYVDSVMEIGKATQANIAFHNMKAIAALKPKYIRIAKGTPSHEADTDEMLALRYKEHKDFRKIDVRTTWHSRINFDGFIIDTKHVGPSGGNRAWTKSNSAYHYLRSEVMDDIDLNKHPAHLYARGHIHVERRVSYHHKSRGRWYLSNLITVPSMCGIGCYEWSVVRNLKSVTNGWIIVEVKDNAIYKIHDWTQTLDLRHEEQIEW